MTNFGMRKAFNGVHCYIGHGNREKILSFTQGHSPTCPLFPVTIQKQNRGTWPGERGKW